MTLFEFNDGLIRELNGHSKPRPFICDGNPLECKVFIVGINAATEMQQDFWSFWSSDFGYDKDRWLDAYILERKQKPLKPNRTRRNIVSSTRQRIEWITESIKPVKVLETNLFVKATPTADELRFGDRKSEVFEYLLRTIRPEIIFIHGNEVREYFEELYKITITKNQMERIDVLGTKTNILAMNHLSRGWGKRQSIDLGEGLKSEILKRGQ